MKKDDLIVKVLKGGMTPVQIADGIKQIGERIKPNSNKVGDVLMHSVFKHPYVLLKATKTGWICGLLTSEPSCSEVLLECNSRFFYGKYITKVLFTQTETLDRFMGVYDNNKEIREILKQLKTTLGV